MNNNKYFAGPVEAWCASGYAWVSLECGYFQSEKAKTYSLLMSAYASCLDALKKYPHITEEQRTTAASLRGNLVFKQVRDPACFLTLCKSHLQ